MIDTQQRAVDGETYIAIQRALYHEAALLDRRDYAAWLALTTPDISYRVTVAMARDMEAKAVRYAIIDEGSTSLKSRIDQISNPRLTRAENPPSMTRRVVTNVEAFHGEEDGSFCVTSYLLAYRVRPSAPEGGFYIARREDLWRRDKQDWRLARREADLDQLMLFDGALSTLL